MKLYLTPIPLMEQVPIAFREAWARANSTIYDYLLSHTVGTPEHDAGLYWELLLHKVLLRRAPRTSRGRGRRVDSLQQRFHLFELGDYRTLIRKLETHCNAHANSRRTPGQGDIHQAVKQAQRLMRVGQFSRAHSALLTHGVADLDDPDVSKQMCDKHVPRHRALPGSLPQGLPNDVLKVKLWKKYQSLDSLAGTGVCGYRNEYLRCLAVPYADALASKAVSLHEHFAEDFLNARLPSWYYWVVTSVKLVGLLKKVTPVGRVPDVRPIGMGNNRRRAWTGQLVEDHAHILATEMWPAQVAVGVSAGITKMVFALRAHMQAHPDHLLLKLDFSNAFNTMSRAAVLDACYRNPRWRKFYRFFWAVLSPESHIRGIPTGSAEGMQQGDTWGSACFCIGINDDVQWANNEMKNSQGMVAFDMDDGYLAGPPDVVFRVAHQLAQRIFTRCCVKLNLEKCQAWSPCANVVSDALRAHPDTPFKRGTVPGWTQGPGLGVMVSGVPVGDPYFVEFHVQATVDTVLSQTSKVFSSLHCISPQNLYALLVYCANTRVQHLSQCLHPTRTRHAFLRFDHHIAKMVDDITGTNVFHPTATTFAHDDLAAFLPMARMRLPRRLNGGMMRSSMDVASQAYLGGILLAVPSFTDQVDSSGTRIPGILSHLPPHLYGIGSFNHGRERTRFTPMLSGPTPLGCHLRKLWRHVRRLACGRGTPQNAVPKTSAFAVSVEAAGLIGNTVMNKPQHVFTKEIEDRIARSLFERCVLRCNSRAAPIPQPVVAYLSVDRLSRQFVAVPADQVTIIDAAAYKECWATYLGLPSPACSQHVGTPFTDCRHRRRIIDTYGHSVCTAMLPGDLWRKRHDCVKLRIKSLSAWCGLQLDMEVANLFVPFIRTNPAYADMPQRILHGFVPDFRVVRTNTLADVKTFSFSNTWYSRARFVDGRRGDAVRYRADCVHRDSVAKLRRLDTIGGVRGVGPASQRLQSFGRVHGWAFGAFGEASPDVHSLLDALTRQGAASKFRDLGVDTPLLARPHIKQRCCRELGIAVVRSAALHKLHALAAAIMGVTAASQQSRRRQSASAAQRERADSYYHQHSFHADDVPHHRRPTRH